MLLHSFMLLVVTMVSACLCKVQHGRCGASVYCCVVELLLVVTMERSCSCKVQCGE